MRATLPFTSVSPVGGFPYVKWVGPWGEGTVLADYSEQGRGEWYNEVLECAEMQYLGKEGTN